MDFSLGVKKYVPSTRRWFEWTRGYCLGDIDEEESSKVPTFAIISFSFVLAKVVACQDGFYTWLNAADEFTLWSVTSRSTFSPSGLLVTVSLPLSLTLLPYTENTFIDITIHS